MDEHHSDRIIVHLLKEKTKDMHWERLLDDPSTLKKHMLIDWNKCVRYAYGLSLPLFELDAAVAFVRPTPSGYVQRYDKSDVAEQDSDDADVDDGLYNKAETIVTDTRPPLQLQPHPNRSMCTTLCTSRIVQVGSASLVFTARFTLSREL